MNLKRLWDTENKKIVWAVNKSDHKKVYQVWTNDDGSKLYIYKDKREELDQTTEDVKEYWPVWKTLTDEMVGYYLTSEPTELFNRDEWDEASYQFVDWDGTVLKSWKVDEGETPTPPADPTREATAQYTYTFAGWNPTVWKIYKKTTYTATYTATVNKYTITFVDEDWTTELDSQELDYWATPVYAGETPTKTGYTFSWWTPTIATVTADATYTATYEANSYTVTFTPNDATYGSVSPASVTADYGTSITLSNDDGTIIYIGETTVTATAEDGYTFINYQLSGGESLPATVTEDLSIEAVFDVYTPGE